MKKTKLPSLVTILVLTLITVIIWVTFDVYRQFNKDSTPVVPEGVSAPLNPTLDTAIIKEIESRGVIDESTVSDQVVNSPTITNETVTQTEPESTSSGNTISGDATTPNP